MSMFHRQGSSLKSLGRLLLIGVLGTLLALVLTFAAVAAASALPGHGLGYVTGALAATLFVLAIMKLLRVTEPKPARNVERGASGDAEEVELFQAVLSELHSAPAKASAARGGLFLISLVAFLVLGAGFNSVTSLALLVPILFVHELGHLAAMRAFGYRDLSVFFIPLIGAAATGKKERAPAWEQVVVSLMGPAPGLVLAVALAVVVGRQPDHSLLQQAIGLTVIVNAMNLLPFEPFDGGRVVGIVLFANHPRAQVVFGALSSVVLGLLALRFGFLGLGAVAVMVAAGTPPRYRVARCAERFRERSQAELANSPSRPADAPDALIYTIFEDWQRMSLKAGAPRAKPRGIAAAITAVYNAALVPASRVTTRVALGGAYAFLLLPAAFVISKLFR